MQVLAGEREPDAVVVPILFSEELALDQQALGPAGRLAANRAWAKTRMLTVCSAHHRMIHRLRSL
jgi:hypothetical protein